MRTFTVFMLVSFISVAAGAAGLFLAGARSSMWLSNLLALVAGGLAAGGLVAARRSVELCRALALLSLLGLIFTLFSVDQSGVQRWVDLGPLHLNVAAFVLPVVIVCLGNLGVATRLSLAIAALIGSILLLQPDASQATAFLVAMIFLLARHNGSMATKLVAAVAATALAVATWYRPDPLEPVAEVEQIFSLLHEISPALSAIAGIGLAVSSLAPLLHRNRFDGRDADIAYALAAYFCLCALAPAVGAFPVPLVGLGMSFPAGYWLAIGLLCARPPRR